VYGVRCGGSLLQEINIKLWRHTKERDWSAEVNGKLYEHIFTKTLDEFVEYVLVAAQQALLKPETLLGKSATLRDLLVHKRPPSSLAKAGTSGIHMLKR
jgi:hypothetical protein